MAIKHFHKKNLKVGHAGTLDPLATGVLLVCIGKATKLAETFQKARKQYIAGVTFGATTASYDLEKEVDGFCDLGGVSEEALRGVLPSFVGEQDQVAPLFSAKSVDGVRVYEIARKRYKAGLPVDDLDVLQASRINIYDLSLQSYRGGGTPPGGDTSPVGQDDRRKPSNRINVAEVPEGLPQAEILVDCSKGTYIRALARDLGEALGSGAFLHSLRRTKNGGFSVEEALSIEDIASIFR
jgi:tRNA pseudouridine55 synthase